MRTLDVYRDHRLVGHLRDIEDELEFEYCQDDAENRPRPISASIPVDKRPLRGARVRAFFGNLLPEGSLRDDLAARFKIDGADDLGLLGKIGADCAGALVVLPAGETPPAAEATFETLYMPLENAYEFGQYVGAIGTSPVATFKGSAARMSLAGAQSKTVIARFGGAALFRCIGGASTHVVKIGNRLNQRGEEEYPDIVFNEYLCSKLAQACGLQVPPVEILPYQTYRDGTPEFVFVIQRYDRLVRYDTRQVERLHQEDFCQALGRPRSQKYEAQGGISLADMFAFVRDPDRVTVPAISQKRLLEAVLFNLVIGNRDSHAKNYSLLRGESKAELAPLYDLVCTQAYANIDQSLAQRVGAADHFAALTRHDLEIMAEQIELRPSAVIREASRVCNIVLKKLQAVTEAFHAEPRHAEKTSMAKRIGGIAGGNARALLDRLK